MKPLKLGLFTLALGAGIARASTINLPTPDPSPYPDTESSVNIAVTNWPSLGRRITLSLTAYFTPSNCVQLAFGQDTNADGDLAPEETHLVLGVDCNVPFSREGFGQWRSGVLTASTEEPTLDCPPPPSTFTFAFRQPSPLAARLTHAKITTRGRGESAAQIAAEIRKPGKVLFLR